MSNEKRPLFNAAQARQVQVIVADLTDEQLLDLYLALPMKIRNDHFVNTASAAQIAGITQRTVQLWIESGALRAVLIGKKYKVSLDSLKAYLKSQARK